MMNNTSASETIGVRRKLVYEIQFGNETKTLDEGQVRALYQSLSTLLGNAQSGVPPSAVRLVFGVGPGPRIEVGGQPVVAQPTNQPAVNEQLNQKGYVSIGQVNAKRTKNHGNRPIKYIYLKNPLTKDYAFRVIDGESSTLYELGSLSDENSRIGSFLRRLPSAEKFTKGDLYRKSLVKIGGTYVKAFMDILQIEGYVKRENSIKRRGSAVYSMPKNI